MSDRPLVRTSPGTSLLMVGNRIVVHSSDGRRTLELPVEQVPGFVAVLAALSEWREVSEAGAAVAREVNVSPARAAATVAALAEAGVLESEERDARFAKGEPWTQAGWADAYLYHRHLRLLPMIDWSLDESVRADVTLMREYVAEGDQPSPYLALPTADTYPVPMPPPDRLGPIADTRTAPAEALLEWAELAAVLAFTFGQTGTRRLPVTGLHITKTSPSGGSRHPTEAFVLLLQDVDCLRPGSYHWNVRDRALDLIEHGDFAAPAREHLIRLPGRPAFTPVAVVVLVAVCERSMFRYRESRSYRVLLHDVGHLLQTFAYAASALGRPTYRGYTVHEQAVTTLLGLDPLEQIPLAFGVLG